MVMKSREPTNITTPESGPRWGMTRIRSIPIYVHRRFEIISILSGPMMRPSGHQDAAVEFKKDFIGLCNGSKDELVLRTSIVNSSNPRYEIWR